MIVPTIIIWNAMGSITDGFEIPIAAGFLCSAGRIPVISFFST